MNLYDLKYLLEVTAEIKFLQAKSTFGLVLDFYKINSLKAQFTGSRYSTVGTLLVKRLGPVTF